MATNNQSLLQRRFQKEHDEQEIIVKKVEESEVHATDNEIQIIQEISERISNMFKEELAKTGFTPELTEKIKHAISREVGQLKNCTFELQKRVEKIALANITGLGAITQFMQNPAITEVVVQRYDNICVEIDGRIYATKASFADENTLRNIINRIVQPVGRQINLHTPIVDARLADGSRVHATIPPISPDGATLTIRKFSDEVITADDYLNKHHSLSEDMLYFLSECVKGKESILVSGGTGSGKTTLLNMLSGYIPENELIVTIEDDCELKLKQKNVRRLEARNIKTDDMKAVTIRDLVRTSLRMRPDRIIVGEIRDGSVVDMITAMSTGHEGSMSSVHSNSPTNLVNTRLPVLYSMCEDAHFSEQSQMLQISEAVHLIVQISRMPDFTRKITHITAVEGMDTTYNRIKLVDIFRYSDEKGYYATGNKPKSIIQRLKSRGIVLNESIFEAK